MGKIYGGFSGTELLNLRKSTLTKMSLEGTVCFQCPFVLHVDLCKVNTWEQNGELYTNHSIGFACYLSLVESA